MITPAFGLTATERVLPKLALDFTTAVLDARVTVTRTTNATNPATYINSSGVITAATNNQPRFDYDPVTLLCRGLLIEEARANSLLNTDLLATQSVTVTAAVRTLSFYGTGTVTLSGTHTAVVSGTGAYPTRTTYSFTPSAGALTLTVTGTVQFAQLELGAFATSYIPTTTTSLTRNADVVSMTGANLTDWLDTTQGTILSEYMTPQIIAANTSYVYSLGSSATAAVYAGVTTTGNNQYTVINTTNQANFTFANGALNIPQKICGFYKANQFLGAANALAGTLDTSGTVPTISKLVFGARDDGARMLNGWARKFSYWAFPLTAAEVTAFSKQ
jgi:hypothetical protein